MKKYFEFWKNNFGFWKNNFEFWKNNFEFWKKISSLKQVRYLQLKRVKNIRREYIANSISRREVRTEECLSLQQILRIL